MTKKCEDAECILAFLIDYPYNSPLKIQKKYDIIGVYFFIKGRVNMIYKNTEIHNAAELEINEKDGSMTWYRLPKSLMDTFELGGGNGMSLSSTGVEIRFVIKSGSAAIKMQSISEPGVTTCFHVYRGGIQGGWQDHEVDKFVFAEPHDFVIERSDNLDTLKKIADDFGDGFSPEVVRIIFERGRYRILDITGDIVPPAKEQLPQKTLMCYGSSITHGSNSIDSSHAWASVLAHNLNMDLRNLGMAGSCAMEHGVIDYIASEGENGRWDTAVLELGINVLSWEEDKIRERVSYAISQVAGRNKDKNVYVISPFYCGDDYKGSDAPDKWRRLIKETEEKLNFKNVRVINGLEVLDSMKYISADEVHPNIYGVQRIADTLTKRLQQKNTD